MQSQRRFWFRFLGIGLLILIISLFLVIPSARFQLTRLSSGFMRVVLTQLQAVRSLGRTLRHPLRAIIENDSLHKQLESISLDRAEFDRLRQENAQLREASNFIQRLRVRSVESRIVGEFDEARDEYWILDEGSNQGIAEGDVVVSPLGIFIGIIRTIAEDTASVRLISSPSESFPVRFESLDIDAIARGDNNGEYIVGLVPEEATINIGDIVVTSGRSGNIPAGIVVGSVAVIEHRGAGSFQDIRLKTTAPLHHLDRVLVLHRN